MTQMLSVFVSESGSPGVKWIYINILKMYDHIILPHLFRCFKYQQVFLKCLYTNQNDGSVCYQRSWSNSSSVNLFSCCRLECTWGKETLSTALTPWTLWVSPPPDYIRVRTVCHLPEASNHLEMLDLPLVSSCCLIKRMNGLFIL